MRKLIIIGAGGHGKVIADAAEKMNIFEEISFLDDNKVNELVLGHKVIDTISKKSNYKNTHEFIIGIGDNKARMKIQSKLIRDNYKISTVVHPQSIIGKSVAIGLGTVIMAGTVVNSDTKIGNGCIINTSVSIDHDCDLDDFVHLSPKVALSGEVKIGRLTWIGTGSSVINNVNINHEIIIGSHSNITKSLFSSGTYVGNPVRKVK